MLSDGMLGNKSILLALSALTTGNLNSKLRKDASPYRIQDILPMAHEYIIPPLSEEEKQQQVSNTLIAFMQRSPNAPAEILNGPI
jgi:hypothetical protein